MTENSKNTGFVQVVFSSWHRFRFRLTLIILASTLFPLLLTGWLVLQMASSSLHDLIVKKHQAVLDAVAGGTEVFLNNQAHRLEAMTVNPFLQSLDRPRVEHALHDFLADNQFFVELRVFDRQKKIVGIAKRHSKRQLDEIVGRPLSEFTDADSKHIFGVFDRTIQSEGAIEIFPSQEKAETEKKLWFLLPIPNFVDSGKTDGLIAAQALVSGTDIQGILNSFPSHQHEYVCILQATGEIIARKGTGLSQKAFSFALPSMAKPDEAPAQAKTFSIDNQGRLDLLSLTYSRMLKGYILIGQPADEAFVLVTRLREQFLILILLAFVLSMAGSYFLAGTIARPIQDLTDGLIKVQDGVYSHRLSIKSEDELGQAGKALNGLAQALQKKMIIASIWEKIRPNSDKMP